MHQTASRLTWSLACDDGLAFSSFFQKVHSQLRVPVNALLLNWAAGALVGILYMVSASGNHLFNCLDLFTLFRGRFIDMNLLFPAFNAFIATSIILSAISISMPIALLLYRRRGSEFLPANRKFRLPSFIGFFCNFIAVAWAVVETVFFCFPTSFPVTGSNMSMPPFALSDSYSALKNSRLCLCCSRHCRVSGFAELDFLGEPKISRSPFGV